MTNSNALLAIYCFSLVVNVVNLYFNYPEAKRHIETKRRFIKAKMPYREVWINKYVAMVLLSIIAVGACLCCLVIYGLAPLLAK